jgi:hypothetical protein
MAVYFKNHNKISYVRNMQRFFMLHVVVHNVSTGVYKAKISKRRLWTRKRDWIYSEESQTVMSFCFHIREFPDHKNNWLKVKVTPLHTYAGTKVSRGYGSNTFTTLAQDLDG